MRESLFNFAKRLALAKVHSTFKVQWATRLRKYFRSWAVRLNVGEGVLQSLIQNHIRSSYETPSQMFCWIPMRPFCKSHKSTSVKMPFVNETYHTLATSYVKASEPYIAVVHYHSRLQLAISNCVSLPLLTFVCMSGGNECSGVQVDVNLFILIAFHTKSA